MASLSFPPVPVDAVFGVGDLTCVITFDVPIEPIGARDISNWTVTDVGGARVVTGAVVQFDGKMQLTLQAPTGGGAPGTVSFSPPPFDMADGCSNLVEAFAGFPVS